jgi:hypothetical protein
MPDLLRVARAVATNQVARFAPAAYVRLTGQTGRGDAAEETVDGIADYFLRCVDDYFSHLGVSKDSAEAYLSGKTLLEYGPGDMPGVAVLLVGLGAEKVYCVDRFPLVSLDERNVQVMQRLIESATPERRLRMLSCFTDETQLALGLDPARVEYLVKPNGLSGLQSEIDLVYSRAVMEHVNDLEATFRDMLTAMRKGALAIHQVDLGSHGLHRHHPLDFLEPSPALWSAMFSAKGVPNRWRVDRYRQILSACQVKLVELCPTKLADPRHVDAVRPKLAKPFRGIASDDLAWLGFWCVFSKATV